METDFLFNDPEHDRMAVVFFPNRSAEPKGLTPYQTLLQSRHLRRVFLNELTTDDEAPAGLTILQLATAAENQTKGLASRLLRLPFAGFVSVSDKRAGQVV